MLMNHASPSEAMCDLHRSHKGCKMVLTNSWWSSSYKSLGDNLVVEGRANIFSRLEDIARFSLRGVNYTSAMREPS